MRLVAQIEAVGEMAVAVGEGKRADGDGPKEPSRLSRLLAPFLVQLPWFRRRFLLERWFLRTGDAPLA